MNRIVSVRTALEDPMPTEKETRVQADRGGFDRSSADRERASGQTEKETHEATQGERESESGKLVGGERYVQELRRMESDLREWMRQNGFEKATGLRREDRRTFGS